MLKFIMIEEEKKVVNVGKKISAFFQFVLDDPVMLCLCIAIIVLIILYIIVLTIGKKADKKDKIENKKDDELLKTEVDLSVLDETAPQKEPVVSEDASQEEAVPITVVIEEQPSSLEVLEEVEETPVIESEPVTVNNDKREDISIAMPSFDDYKIEFPVEEEKKIPEEINIFNNLEENVPNNPIEVDKVEETPVEVAPVEEVPIVNEPLGFDPNDYVFEPNSEIILSSVNPIEEVSEKTSEPVKLATQEVKPQEESLSDVYGYDDSELPSVNVEDFNRTALIRHIPMLDSKIYDKIKENDKEQDELADVDLPKLSNANSELPMFNDLKGESFNIPKNS